MLLSIIIPYYNTRKYTDKLLKVLDKQMRPDVEVILIDDGSSSSYSPLYSWLKVYRKRNGGASSARNAGLDRATGLYVAFIDSDDMVSDDYIEKVTSVLLEKPDYVYLSWATLPGSSWQCTVKLNSIEDKFPSYNLCVWNRIYKRSMIGDTRFNTEKLIAEDAEFIRDVVEKGKKAIISNIVYYYRSDTPNSLSKRFNKGELNTSRVAYYFNHVTADMTYLIEEFKQADKASEVILLTNRNDIPELNNYAMILAPCRVRATEKRGENTNMIELIKKPIKTQVVMWTDSTYEIGGIETFIYSFCRQLYEFYDIMILYRHMDVKQLNRLSSFVECRPYNPKEKIICDTLIVNRIIDPLPSNVTAKQTVQMVHGVKHGNYHVPQDRDVIVSVSKAVKESFMDETKDSQVIRNMTYIEPIEHEPLKLISTTRIDCADKGFDRMVKLAKLMETQNVSYVWLIFTNRPLPNDTPKNMIAIPPTLDILPYVKASDYLVQLSDHEAFCYSMVEALLVGTPVIVTPLTVLDELKVKNGQNSYVVPFEIENDFDTKQFLNIPSFKYNLSNTDSVKKWKKLLGDTQPTKSYVPKEQVCVKITKQYKDMLLDRTVVKNEIILVSTDRALQIESVGFGYIMR